VIIALVIFVFVLIAAHGFGWLAIILAALGAGGYYRYDVWRRPLIPCRWCKGSKGNRSRITRAYGRCWRCGGSGEHSRPAARILTPGAWRDIQDGRHGRNY
jgi:hypothetical protein